MNRCVFTLCVLCLISAGAPAQQGNYRLDKYVNPDYNRKQLDFSFSTTGDMTSYKSSANDYDKQDISGNAGLSYSQIVNSEKIQNSLDGSASFNGSYTGENDALPSMDGAWGTALSFRNKAFYYVAERRFIEFSPVGNFNFRRSKSETSEVIANGNTETHYTSEETSKSLDLNFSFDLGYGIGRVEQVGDARQAMYILTDLQQYGMLKRTLDNDEVNALADRMTKIKNKRQFDNRLKLIEEIADIDSFLVANGYAGVQHPSLYDNWLYAGLIERKAGSRLSAGIAPAYTYNKHNQGYTYTPGIYPNTSLANSNHILSVSPYVKWEYEKPLDLYWQHSAGARLWETWFKHNNPGTDYEYDFWSTYISGYFGLGYYPNSRTHIAGTINQETGYTAAYKGITSISRLIFDMYYYFSPQLRLTANCELRYDYHAEENGTERTFVKNKYPNLSFNLGVTYSIF